MLEKTLVAYSTEQNIDTSYYRHISESSFLKGNSNFKFNVLDITIHIKNEFNPGAMLRFL